MALEEKSTSIGRSPSRTIVLRDPCVSRMHALILRDGNGFVVADQNSTHGTFLNGVRIQRAALRSGDRLQLGSLSGPELEFSSMQPADSAPRRPELPEAPPTDLLSSLSGFPLVTRELPPAARSMEHLNWLLGAARRLNQGAAIEDTLDALLQLTLQLTGLERGFAFLAQAGEMRLARGLNAAGELLHEDSTVSRKAIQQAIQSHSSFSVSDTMADDEVSGWTSMIAHRIRSVYCIPLRKRGAAPAQDAEHSGAAPAAEDLLGLLYVDSQVRPGHLSEVDHQLLETVATEAAALLHNAQLAEAEFKARKEREELAIAASIHSGLMSIDLPVLSYATLQARSVPCLAIGGDFFDALALDDCVAVTVADVSGKGVAAAIVAATLQGIIHAQLLAGQPLPEIAALLNRFLCTRNVGKYATLVVLKLFADGRVEYINCGHIQPLAVLGDRVRRLAESNLIVGLIPSAVYASASDALQPGERVLLATDGITEAEDAAGEPFGDAGLSAVAPCGDVAAILDRIAAFHAPHPAQDDCTLLQVCYEG